MTNIVTYPTNPVQGQEFTVGETIKVWDGEKWENKTPANNPHNVTKAQVGLGDVDNVSAANLRDRGTHTGTQPLSTISDAGSAASKDVGTANGVASLDGSGKVPDSESQVPSGVIKAQLIGQGLSGNYGFFEEGFTYSVEGDIGIDADGNSWIYVGAGAPNKVVTAGTVPSVGAGYEQVTFNSASDVINSNGDSVQDFIDSFALKIFQSPTDGGLTEINTRTVNANEVYEVRKTTDDSLAAIYSDAAGTTEIVQNGTDNVSGSDGVVKFYIADGDYYVLYNGDKHKFSTLTSALVLKVALMAQGYSGNFGYFTEGFTFNLEGDVGIGTDGKIYTYAGNGSLPVVVDELTDPTASDDYEERDFINRTPPFGEISQEAFTKNNGKGRLHISVGRDFPDEELKLRSGGLQSEYPSLYAANFDYIKTYKPILAGYDRNDPSDKGDHGGHNADLRGVAISSQDPTDATVKNHECHWQAISDCSFRGNKNADVPHMYLGASLYNLVDRVDFGGKCDGIIAKQSYFDVAYYGVNASWFRNLQFNLNGTAMHVHGIFSLRDSTIENTRGVGKPRIILGETGQAPAAMSVLDHVYFETGNDTGYDSAPLIEVQSNQCVAIRDSVLVNRSKAGQQAVVIKTTTGMAGSNVINHNSMRPVSGTPEDIATLPTAIDWTTTSNSHYFEAIGNDWASGSQYPTDKMIVINGVPLKEHGTSISAYTTGRWYIRDEVHGEVRRNMPSRDIWCDHYREVDANTWKLDGGRNLLLTYAPTQDVTVESPEKWKGASFKMHFHKSATLKHGTGFFELATAKDTTFPIGAVVEFCVDFQGKVREVGCYSLVINP